MRHPVALRIAALGILIGLGLLPCQSTCAEQAPRWIVVYAPAYEAAIEPLVALRRAQGYEVLLVDAHEVLGQRAVERGLGLPLRMKVMQLCRGRIDDSSVLLVGALRGEDETTVIPPLTGRVGRMKGRPTDNGYGNLDRDPMPEVAVGRLPARTVDEARVMIEKTVAFDALEAPQPWSDRITLLVGHPGGPTPMARRFAASMVEREVLRGFERAHPRWTVSGLLHMESSPYCVPDGDLGPVAKRMLQAGQLFTIYLGHSGAGGLWSGMDEFLRREDFRRLDMTPGAGVLLSCGCHACEIRGLSGQGYALAAVRNPKGPVAAIGAHGESYGAMGKLAFEGLLPHLAAAEPPRRLGAWWLALKRGIAEGPIGPLVFELYDRADGSNGKVPLEVQRQEHLEMWMLLGDPALRLPIAAQDILLGVTGDVVPGGTLVIRGRLPAAVAGDPPPVLLRVDRPFGSQPKDLEPLATEGKDASLRKRYAEAHAVEILSTTVELTDRDFEASVTLPSDLPWDRIVVRAEAEEGRRRGALVLPVVR